MNLTLPEKEKVNKRRIIVYSICILICVLAIIIVIGNQVLGNNIIDNLFGINRLTKRTEQEEMELKSNFEYIFDNKVKGNINYRIQKVDNNKEIVYNNYKIVEKKDKYDLDVNLPYINIKNKEIQKFNKEISDIFEAKAEEIIKNKEENIIYTVRYKATIENEILSIAIYSDLKQDTNAQRVIIQTFNFNLEENKELELEDILKIYNLSQSYVQNKINKVISDEQKRTEDLKEIGYNIFSRDIESEIYKIENVKEYFIYNNNIYIIFAYGNEDITSEMDIVII